MTYQFKTFSEEELNNVIKEQTSGKNTSFLNAAHSLWYRFKNYKNSPPVGLIDENSPVAFVFFTLSQRTKYINLYEIVTLEKKEGKGYASILWSWTMMNAHQNGMRRLKISCTPSSVTWHKKNGLIFWAVDPSGSLRSDQPLYPTVSEQKLFRDCAVKDPSIALPSSDVIEKLKQEGYETFGNKKKETILTAIESVKPYWFRDELFKQSTLESFM
jgi:hypothetical protein